MNDDFFICEPTGELPPVFRGPLDEHIGRVTGDRLWRQSLTNTRDWLQANGRPEPISYELHVPVAMKRDLLGKVLGLARDDRQKVPPQWRTLYGNWWQVEGRPAEDCKFRRRDTVRPARFLSSVDASFGRLQTHIHGLFPHPGPYEKTRTKVAS